uniref:Uncharacterized protein n=1 Tax=Meloidogyne enterolobii TaxID=390850 RepID=A0A6V7W7P4_MELEN|nr:unnamed protein product [Meloidogyne enterolobii]
MKGRDGETYLYESLTTINYALLYIIFIKYMSLIFKQPQGIKKLYYLIGNNF